MSAGAPRAAGLFARSLLFAAIQAAITPPFAVVSLLLFPFSPYTRYRVITLWCRAVIAAARGVCGIRYRVTGLEHLPASPCVILAKHQSAWETIAFPVLLPPQSVVLKRELLWIPFFGWGLAMLSPIAIDRGAGRRAVKQMLEQGAHRLSQGFWVMVFPEGTRMAPGERGRYRSGGAAIAVHAGVPVLPVAHNAGRCWPRRAFLKRPGLITISIGPLMDSRGCDAETLTRRSEDWIEAEMSRLESGDRPA